MTRTANVLAVLVVASTFALAACDSTQAPSAPSVSRSASSSPVTSPSPSGSDRIRLLDAQGADLAVHWVGAPAAAAAPGSYTVVSTLTQPKVCGRQLVARALFPDASWFVGITPAAQCSWQAGPLPASDGVGLLPAGQTTVTTWRPTTSLVAGDHARQVTSGTTDGTTVVWSETAGTDLDVDNWRVFAASRTDGRPHLVARAEELTGGKDLPFYDCTYTIDGATVYWGSASTDLPNSSQAYAPQVVSKALTGTGAITVVARDADQPVTTDRGVVVRTIAMTDVIGQDAQGKAERQRRMAADGIALVTPHGLQPLVRIASDAPLPFGVHVDALAGSGSHVAFAVGPTEYVLDLDTGRLTGFQVQGSPVPGTTDLVLTAPVVVYASAASPSLLVWSYGNGAPTGTEPVFVYQFPSGTLHQLDGALNGGQVWAAGDDVAWDASDGTNAFETVASWTP